MYHLLPTIKSNYIHKGSCECIFVRKHAALSHILKLITPYIFYLNKLSQLEVEII